MNSIGRSSLFALLLAPLLAGESQAQSSRRSLSELLPPETSFFISADNLGDLEAAWRKTGFHAFYEQPAMQPFWEEVRRDLLGA